MSGYTKGPWSTSSYSDSEGKFHVMNAEGYAIADMAFEYSSIKNADEHEANALLIAAGPDLFEALVRIMGGTTDLQDALGAAKQAHAAIAKAKGEPHA